MFTKRHTTTRSTTNTRRSVLWEDGERFLTQEFEEWRSALVERGIRPYGNIVGEVDQYRIELRLNELGRAFLTVDLFATEGARLTASG